jgi:hypothetical protein
MPWPKSTPRILFSFDSCCRVLFTPSLLWQFAGADAKLLASTIEELEDKP